MSTTRMSVQDALWLTMDRPNNLMVVDGAVVLGGVPAIDRVQDAFTVAVDRFPVLRSTAQRDGSSWDWVEDDTFDIRNHVKAVSLDAPADLAALQRFVAEQRSLPLNRERPLWSAFLVAPLTMADGVVGAAIVTRFHHAIGDGVRLTQLLLGLCVAADDVSVPLVARTAPPAIALPDLAAIAAASNHAAAATADATRSAVGSAVGAAGGIADALSRAARSAVTDPGAAAAAVPSALAAAPARAWTSAVELTSASRDRVEEGFVLARHPDRLLDALEELGMAESRPLNTLASAAKLLVTEGEPTVWTGTPGTTKAVAWSAPMPLADVKVVGQRFGATVNDVLLAVVAGALRAYLAERDEAIDEVVWMVPVNLKPFEVSLPEDLGNFFALVMLAMPLTHESPADRLADVRSRMLRIKHSDEPVLTFGLQRTLSVSPANIATFLTNFFANKAVGILTNVPGPTGPMTFADVPVRQVVGFAPCSGDQPMTATIFTFDGEVTIGFATDAGLVPDPESLVEHVVDAFDELVALAREE